VPGTLIDVFDWWALERKDTPAIVAGSQALTYLELQQWSSVVGQRLLEEGLARGDRVTILAANSLQWVVLAHAVLRAGGILAPINPKFTVSELAYLIDHYDSRFIFFDRDREENAREVGISRPKTHCLALELVNELRGQPPLDNKQVLVEGITPDSEIVIIPTSGSTGRPKGVVYSNRTVLNYCQQFALAESHAADQPGVVIFAPLCTSAGYVVMNQHLVYGGTVFIEEAFDPKKTLDRISAGEVTTIMGVPFFFEQMSSLEEFEVADVSSIRIATVGGSRCSSSLLETWLKKGVLIRQLYGQTECGGQGTINTLEASLQHPEKCGRGNIFTRVAVVNDAGDFCEPGVPGEIVIKGPSNMVRYWNDPQATDKTIKNGWLHTGDLGVLDEQGLLTFLDRIKDIIISGGLNISAAEVERVIVDFPGVEEVAVIATADEKYGETPLAVVYAPQALDVEGLMKHCKRELSSYKLPRYIAFETMPLPRLATQKVSKPELRKKYHARQAQLTPLLYGDTKA
jgi:fatty-acyl-CoA synthase